MVVDRMIDRSPGNVGRDDNRGPGGPSLFSKRDLGGEAPETVAPRNKMHSPRLTLLTISGGSDIEKYLTACYGQPVLMTAWRDSRAGNFTPNGES
jgi:hypothetical protein